MVKWLQHPRLLSSVAPSATLESNALDAVSDRDFALEVLAGTSIALMYLSGLSEEEVYEVLALEHLVNVRERYGGTAQAQIAEARAG